MDIMQKMEFASLVLPTVNPVEMENNVIAVIHNISYLKMNATNHVEMDIMEQMENVDLV